MQLLTLLAVSLVSATLFHRKMSGLLIPSLISALMSATVFHLIGLLIEGALSSLVLVSMMTTFVIAFLVAITLGLLMRSSGRKPPIE